MDDPELFDLYIHYVYTKKIPQDYENPDGDVINCEGFERSILWNWLRIYFQAGKLQDVQTRNSIMVLICRVGAKEFYASLVPKYIMRKQPRAVL